MAAQSRTVRRGAQAVALVSVAACVIAFGSACSGGGEPQPTPKPIIEGNAIQIFLREAYKIGWFAAGDPIDLDSEPLLYHEALARAEDMGLTLYPTVPGTPPYPDGLPGWLITARGDFFDSPDGASPGPDAPRRPAIAAAFVDTHGRLTYSMRFTDITPAPQTPKETLPPTYP